MVYSVKDVEVTKVRNLELHYMGNIPFLCDPPQDTIPHESFTGPAKNWKQGNIDETFDSIDQTIEAEFFILILYYY